MGQYVLDLYSVENESELRVGASGVEAEIHVLDLIPETFDAGHQRRPCIPAEGLHGRWRSALDWILNQKEGTGPGQCWHPQAPTARIFGTLGDEQYEQKKGRLRFSHALPAGNGTGVGVYQRIRLIENLGTVEESALFDEMVLKEGHRFFFTRIYRAPDLSDEQVEEDLGLLELVDKAFGKHLLGMGAGGALGRGLLQVKRVRRVRVDVQPTALRREGNEPLEKSPYVPALFHQKSEVLVHVPAANLGPAAPSLISLQVTNLGQLWPGRELVAGSQLFGALVTLAMELDGTLPEARVTSVLTRRLVDPDHLFPCDADVIPAKANGWFQRLYKLWAQGGFRISPLIPANIERQNSEDGLTYYNRCAKQVYTETMGHRFYDGQVLHTHHRRDRDKGTVAEGEGGTLRSSVETRAGQVFTGFMWLASQEAREVLGTLLSMAPLADIGFCKHTVLDWQVVSHIEVPKQVQLGGTPHLITRKLDQYMTSPCANGQQYMAQHWTGAFPCSGPGPIHNGRDPGQTEFNVKNGWAVPSEAHDMRGPGRFGVRGLPCHKAVNLDSISKQEALLRGICKLAEWNCLGFGQVVFI